MKLLTGGHVMLRTCFVKAVFSSLLLLTVGSLSAQDSGSSIIFTGCPPYVEGNHCDSMFYQVVAVDLSTGRQCPEMKYILVSGPGTINQRTGLWEFHLERDSQVSNFYGEVEIAAYKGHDTTTSAENCRFGVQVYDQYPNFRSYCGAHITVLPGDTITVPIELSDDDPCDEPRIDSVTIRPEPNGVFSFDAIARTVRFVPVSTDEGKTFEVRVAASSGPADATCSFWFDVFQPDPTKFRIATVNTSNSKPGDTVRVDIILDESAVAFDRVSLTVGFDNTKLRLIDVERGPEFFSEETGCGWDRLDWFGPSYCSYSGPGVVRLMARALASSGAPEPPCLIPESLPATFATFKFVVTDWIMPGEQFAPVSFYWCSCSENYLMSTLPRPGPYHTYMPLAVYSPEGQLMPPDATPGYSGASDDCYYNFMSGERYRLVEFYDGGVNISVAPPEPTYSVRIGYQDEVIQGVFTDVPITLEKFDHTRGLGGFDLLVAYDASALAFQQAIEGDLYDSCGWEYFTYRFGPYGNCGDACPSGIVRIIGLAETNNGPYHPNTACAVDSPGWVSTVPITLAKMRFLVSNDRTLECQFVPLRFFWVECGDNTLVNHDGSELCLSSDVFEFGITTSIAGVEPFPTYRGAQQECFAPGSRVNLRAVDFYNGGLDIVCGDSVDYHGDVNCNGLSYEIADAVMFSNYFVDGLAAFSYRECSIAASDANYDGETLTIEDLVFLIRVVIGDVQPQYHPSPNPGQFTWDAASGTVQLAAADSLGAVCLIVTGEITPTLLADQMKMKFGWDTGWTRILIYSTDAGVALTSGDFVSIPGALGIVSIEAATFDGRAVTEIISDVTGVGDEPGNLPLEFALHANYPNPFNPTTTIRYDLPEQADVRIAVYNVVGQVVRTLVNRPVSAGQYETVWDGRDDSGRQVSSGVYLYRMTAGDFTQSRKMLLLK
ncbi:MAG: T9SS type A sorting domain-containing protein [candidate division Zixibacteria bacterium]|nr:T9SS type A sorting domain-containing protein [candidate division Zixibacteria bacterium]